MLQNSYANLNIDLSLQSLDSLSISQTGDDLNTRFRNLNEFKDSTLLPFITHEICKSLEDAEISSEMNSCLLYTSPSPRD